MPHCLQLLRPRLRSPVKLRSLAPNEPIEEQATEPNILRHLAPMILPLDLPYIAAVASYL